jgi:hypothetical protein
MINNICKIIVVFFICNTQVSFSQTDTSKAAEEDFSQYADMETTDNVPKVIFCTSKIIGQSPNRLISLGYDFVGSHTANVDSFSVYNKEDIGIKSNQVLRFVANFPIISNTKWLVNLGANYMSSNYSLQTPKPSHAMVNALEKGFTTTGVNATVFKPFNSKNFTLVQTSYDVNGDYKLNKFQPINTGRFSIAAVYGWKKHDRLIMGFGLSRTFRAGEAAYFPIFMYNYTSVNKKWGFECLLPARGAFRYNINARNFLSTGFELEGNTYRLQSLNNSELRRSEVRFRLNYDFSLHNFIWLGIQGGLRYNYKFNVDSKFFNRGFGDSTPYTMNNTLTNPLFFAVSLNLVSP